MFPCGELDVFERLRRKAYVAWPWIPELGMTVCPAGIFYLSALPLVDPFQRIDWVFFFPRPCMCRTWIPWSPASTPQSISLCSSLLLRLRISSFDGAMLGGEQTQRSNSCFVPILLCFLSLPPLLVPVFAAGCFLVVSMQSNYSNGM